MYTDPQFNRILIVDDDEDVLLAARLLLKAHAESLVTEKEPRNIPALLRNHSYDVILLDMNFALDSTSGKEGFFWLEKILEIDPDAVVILITAFGDVETAVRAIRAGATDFVLKPWQNEKLLATLSAAYQLRKSRIELGSLRAQQHQLSEDLDQQFHDLIGVSAPIREVFATVRKVAATDANVLILGENGTGKELVARALHRQSRRKGQVFISVDMGAVSESLFESELFGHTRGSFTDARKDRAGRFEVASGGTLFLDEIGNLPLPLQAKLLTVLESRTVTRLGSNKPVPFDVRLICATNMRIHEMVAQDRFRQDLLYRINTVEISLPPLCERSGDIQLLAGHFLEIYCKKYQKPLKKLSFAALEKLRKYPWPGNVRELQHAVERAIILSDKQVLQPGDFLLSRPEQAKKEGLVFEEYNMELVEKIIIRKAIEKHGGNISRAARELGYTRSALYRRLEKYGL
ncbi:MAG: sigma-54-dependent Fis family transcriptional regulator [Candidatus Glassbacteria bacterium]|nr:sigma-54-dependent Fis family transcriptional regulator [Candidatus Glassbacteria bacterium]